MYGPQIERIDDPNLNAHDNKYFWLAVQDNFDVLDKGPFGIEATRALRENNEVDHE